MMVTTFNAVVDLDMDNTITNTKHPVPEACSPVSLIVSCSLTVNMTIAPSRDNIPTTQIQYVLFTNEYVSTIALRARTFLESSILHTDRL